MLVALTVQLCATPLVKASTVRGDAAPVAERVVPCAVQAAG